MRRLKYLWFLVLCIFIGGCVLRSAPPGNVGFLSVESLKEFEGVYRNLGDSGPDERPVYLSSLIWEFSNINHPTVTAVEVSAPNADTLIVTALRGDQVEREDSFVRERDFKIRNGRIQLTRQWVLLNEGAGDPLVGPRYETFQIGLDAKGDGKYRKKGAFAGLVFLLIPVAVSHTQEVRFIRLEP